MAKSVKSSRADVPATFIQPNVEPREGKPGRMTNCLKQFEVFLNSVRRMKYCLFFVEPVNTLDCHVADYYDIIEEPMDIGTILKRINNKYYCSITEALGDFQQILRNCFKYNKEGDECYKNGIHLKRVFEKNILKYPEVEEDYLTAAQQRRKGQQKVDTTQPPVIEEEEPPPHIIACKELLNALLSYCPYSSHYFAKPVELWEIHTGDRYNEVILEPMDYLTIKTKLKYLLYKDLNEFVYDMRLICLNGRTIYKSTDEIYEAVEFIGKTFENLLSFYRTYERLPNQTEMPLIITPWEMPIPQKEDSPETTSSNVENGELEATFEVPLNDRMKMLKIFKEISDEVKELDNLGKKFEKLCAIALEESALQRETRRSVNEEDLAFSVDECEEIESEVDGDDSRY